MALEAGLNPSQGPISLPDTIDEKADLKGTAQAEADIVNLNKKVADLGMQLNQQLEQNSVAMKDSYIKDQPNHQAKKKDKPKRTEAAFKRSRSKDEYLDEAERKNEKQQESSSGNKHPPQNQQLDNSVHNSNNSNASETVAQKPLAPSNSKFITPRSLQRVSVLKKANAVIKGANSTTSALTKLTIRLNFLKERRSQMTNELLVMDKDRGSSQAVPSSDKAKGPEPISSVQNPAKSRGPDVSQEVQNPDKVHKKAKLFRIHKKKRQITRFSWR